MVGILGRMAAESGKMITWDEAMNSNLELAPGLDKLTMDSAAARASPTRKATTRSPCRGSRRRFERPERAATVPAEGVSLSRSRAILVAVNGASHVS